MLVEWFTFTFIAIALGLDGFSVCLAIGLYHLSLRRILLIGILVGLCHMVLPLIGLLLGLFMSMKWTTTASVIGSFILCLVGLYMIFSSLQEEEGKVLAPYGLKLWLIVFLISIDSFSVGMSLGLSGVRNLLFIFLFGFFAMILAWCGLLLGKQSTSWFGVYSELFGGFILLSLGLAQLFFFPQ